MAKWRSHKTRDTFLYLKKKYERIYTISITRPPVEQQ